MKKILKALALLVLPSLAMAGVHIQQGDTNVQLGYVNVSSLTCSGTPCGTGGGGSSSGTIIASPQFQVPYYSLSGTTNTLTGMSGVTTTSGNDIELSTITASSGTISGNLISNGITSNNLTVNTQFINGQCLSAGEIASGNASHVQTCTNNLLWDPTYGFLEIYSNTSGSGAIRMYDQSGSGFNTMQYLNVNQENAEVGMSNGYADWTVKMASQSVNSIDVSNLGKVTIPVNLYISSGLYANNSAGTNGQVLTSGGAGTVPTWTTISGGGGSPGGSNTQMQFNNSGSFGGTNFETVDASSISFNNISSMTYIGFSTMVFQSGTALDISAGLISISSTNLNIATCGDASHALGWSSATDLFSCVSIAGGGGGTNGSIVAAPQYSAAYYSASGSTTTVSGVPPGLLGQILMTSTITVAPSWISISSIVIPGSGIATVLNPVNNVLTVNTDSTIVPRYFVGATTPTQTCAAGRDIYTDSVSSQVYVCVGTNFWSQALSTSTIFTSGGSGGASALQVTQGGVQITSPTASMNFQTNQFTLAAVGSTSTIALNASSVTLQGTLPTQLGTVSVGTWNGTRLTSSFVPTDVAYVDVNNIFTSPQNFTSPTQSTFTYGLTVGSLTVTGSGAGQFIGVEGAAPSGIASDDILWADSTAHRFKMINNNGTAAQVVASGADINTSDQVTVTHLASALPVNQGGTGTTSTLTGVVRGGSPLTASELSGDATTSGSNAITLAASQGNVTTFTSSITVSNASGFNTTYGVSAGSLTLTTPASAVLATNAAGVVGSTVVPVASGGTGLTTPFARTIYYRAAVCQNGSASSAFSTFTSSKPVAACLTGNNIITGVDQFTSSNTVQDHFALPPNWTGNIDFGGNYLTETSTFNSVGWVVRSTCVPNGSSYDGSTVFGSTITTTVNSSTYTIKSFSQNAITLPTCAAGNEFYWKLTLDGVATTAAGNIDLIDIYFRVRETPGN